MNDQRSNFHVCACSRIQCIRYALQQSCLTRGNDPAVYTVPISRRPRESERKKERRYPHQDAGNLLQARKAYLGALYSLCKACSRLIGQPDTVFHVGLFDIPYGTLRMCTDALSDARGLLLFNQNSLCW